MANKHMKMFLSAVIIKGMQIKTTKTCQVASTRMATMRRKEGRKRMKIAHVWREYGKIGTCGTAAENADSTIKQYGGPSER